MLPQGGERRICSLLNVGRPHVIVLADEAEDQVANGASVDGEPAITEEDIEGVEALAELRVGLRLPVDQALLLRGAC